MQTPSWSNRSSGLSIKKIHLPISPPPPPQVDTHTKTAAVEVCVKQGSAGPLSLAAEVERQSPPHPTAASSSETSQVGGVWWASFNGRACIDLRLGSDWEGWWAGDASPQLLVRRVGLSVLRPVVPVVCTLDVSWFSSSDS